MRHGRYGNARRNSSVGSKIVVPRALNVISYIAQSLALKPTDNTSNLQIMRKHKPDYLVVMIVGVLLVLGLIVIYAVSPALSYRLLGDYSENYFLYKQLMNIGIGVVAFIIASRIPIHIWKRFLPLMILACIVSLILLFIPGIAVSQNGATRWIDIGILSFQPAELLKLTTLFYLAFFLGEKTENELQNPYHTLMPVGIILTVLGFIVVVLQRDMGTMMTLVAIIVGMFYLSEVSLRQFFVMITALGVGAVASIVLFPHRIERLLTFLNPGTDVEGTGYHVHQALIAIGSGGFIGLGLGRSVQVYGYLPEAANDSIFAIWAEKFGFIGSLAVLGLFSALLYRLYLVTSQSQNQSTKLVAGGVFLWISSHVVINVGSMLGIMPLTGITLPFLSYGGSSLLLMLIALGVVLQLSRYTERPKSQLSRNINSYNRINSARGRI